MKAVRIERYGNEEVVELAEVERPKPGENQVLVKVKAPASEFVHKPKQIDFDTAASVPVAALTAWQGIFDHGKLASGQRILITGASGAVGSMAVQLAKNKGARVIGTGSGRNEEFVRKL